MNNRKRVLRQAVQNCVRLMLLPVFVLALLTIASPAQAQSNVLRPGDVLLGVNYEDFWNPTNFPYYYGGVRHAAVWEGDYVIEGGVAWGWHDWWPRGTIRSPSLRSFVNRYDAVWVYRPSGNPSGTAIADSAEVLRRYYSGYLSCVELVEFSRYLAGASYKRYYYPAKIMYSRDFYYVTWLN